MMKLINSSPSVPPRRWSVLFVAALALALASSLQSSICLGPETGFVQTPDSQVESMVFGQSPTEQYDSEASDDLVAFDGGGGIAISNEFYLFNPGREFISNPPTIIPQNSEDRAHLAIKEDKRPSNKTPCQYPKAVNSNGSPSDNLQTHDCNNTKRDAVMNESNTQPSTTTGSTATTIETSKITEISQLVENTNNIPKRGGGNVGGKHNHKKYHSKETPFCLGNRDSELSFNWLCQGTTLVKVPVELYPKPMSLRLSNTGIETLTGNSFPNYRDTLRDFSMENAPKLVAIEEGTFAKLTRLRVVRIVWLTSGSNDNTGLRHWPNLSRFKQERILNSLDLDNNRISTLSQLPINIRTELLNLGFNLISSIDEFTFNGSEIGTLSLSGNRQLSFIHPNAFANLKNLIKLDLSSTSVAQLPPVGLHQLRTLIIRDTYTLKKIPSIYVFPKLEIAHLTYAYHCCSFKYPQTHDPSAYEEHLRLQEELNELCAKRKDTGVADPEVRLQQNNSSGISGGDSSMNNSNNNNNIKHKQSTNRQTSSPPNSDFEGYFEMDQKPDITGEITVTQQPPPLPPPLPPLSSNSGPIQLKQTKHPEQSGTAKPGASSASTSMVEHQSSLNLWLMHNIECGELAVQYTTFPNITCTPEPDAFNPCEDIMGYPVLRVAVWFVVGAAVFGNMSVIVVLMGVARRLSVPKFLQLNLAVGDLFMGIYLAMLAMADLTTVGSYFNFAIDWQHGYGCKVAGAASLFASQLSIFTLCVITFERYYTITYSIDLNMRLQLGWATRIMFLGWLFAFASAMLPIFADISSYTKTSICLPMRTSNLLDRIFLTVLLFIDSSAFVIIFACYLRMYLLIIRQKTEATAKERKIAMRMALLVFTDFACWAPIIFFGATALFGTPLISVTNSKILIVFFYPLNSMANPFLYVITTRQYRRDLNYLTSRWHVWGKNLFNRNNDSYYSNNAAYGAAQYTGSALNAQVAAVAAVTGVAQRYQLRQHQAASNNASNGNNSNGLLRLTEQRVICTKAHKGRYIIRHQILTGGQLPGGAGGGGGGPGAAGGSRGGATCRGLVTITGRQLSRGQLRATLGAKKRIGEELDGGSSSSINHQNQQLGQVSCASKLVNVSTGPPLADDLTGHILHELPAAGCSKKLRPTSSSRIPAAGCGTDLQFINREANCSKGSSAAKKKSSAGSHGSQHRTTTSAQKLRACGEDRSAERACNCCCRCYRWSGTSLRVPNDESQVSPFEVPELSLNEMPGVKSVTVLTSLPNTSANPSEWGAIALAMEQDTAAAAAAAAATATVEGEAEEDPLSKCDARDGEHLTGSNRTASPEPGADPIDILGNISYNDQLSSASGISSLLTSYCNQQQQQQPVTGGQFFLHPEAGAGTRDKREQLPTSTCCLQAVCENKCKRRRRCKCCSRQYYICEYKERVSINCHAVDGRVDESCLVELQVSDPSHKQCRHHQHNHSNNHHHHHHHSHHHHHRRRHYHNLHHHQRDDCHLLSQMDDQQPSDTMGQLEDDGNSRLVGHEGVVLSALQKGYADHNLSDEPDDKHDKLIDFIAPTESSGVGGGGGVGSCCSSVATGCGEHKQSIQSILKSTRGANSQTSCSRGSGKWSPIVSLLRGGSFQSSATRSKEKKRVSIVDHHSG